MKNKIFLAILSILFLISCGPTKNISNGDISIATKIYTYTQVLEDYQLDSLCVTDTLPPLDKWIVSRFKDYETGKGITKCMYIKEIAPGKEYIYIILPEDDKYKLTKRITK